MSPQVLRSEPLIGIELGTGSAEERVIGTKESPSLGIEAILEYRGLILNIRDWIDTFVVTAIAGVDDADVRTSAEAKPGRHGEIPGNSLYGGRTIVLTIKVTTKTIWKLRDMEQALKRAFKTMDIEEPLYFRTNQIENDVFILCKKSQKLEKTEDQQTDKGFQRTWQVTLRASNPRFLSYVRQYQQTMLPPVINLVRNPSGETNLTDVGSAVNANVTRPAIAGGYGTSGFRATAIAAGFFGIYNGGPAQANRFAVTAAQPYFARLNLLARPAGRQTRLNIEWRNAADAVISTSNGPWVGNPGDLTCQANAPAGAVGAVLTAITDTGAAGEVIDVDGWMLVQSATPVNYFDGTSQYSRWSGTAHASTSYYEPPVNQEITYKGTMEAEPVYELTGPLTNFAAVDVNNPFDAFRITGTIPDGSTYIYDASTGALTNKATGADVSSLIADDSGDGQIFEDTTSFDYSATNRGANSKVDLFWRHSYS